MKNPIRWGIIAPGAIAQKFAQGLKAVPNAVLSAVASREADRAAAFAAAYPQADGRLPKAYGSYDQLAADPEVDAVYVASPHPFHMEQSILCLERGKAVLCEKPFAATFAQAERMVAAARAHRVFLMEAMWTRFLPAVQHARAAIRDGRIGTVRQIHGDFSFSTNAPVTGRLLNPALAGGGLLDVGIYVLSNSSFLVGSTPAAVCGLAEIGETGVDVQAAISCRWSGGQVAALTCGVKTKGTVSLSVVGTAGGIDIPRTFYNTEKARVYGDGFDETFERSHLSNGYEYEAMEVGRCLNAGLLESPDMSLDETLELVRIMDTLRASWGVKYPFE